MTSRENPKKDDQLQKFEAEFRADLKASATADRQARVEKREQEIKQSKVKKAATVAKLNAEAASRVDGDKTPAARRAEAREKERERKKSKKDYEVAAKRRETKIRAQVKEFRAYRNAQFSTTEKCLDKNGEEVDFDPHAVNFATMGVSVLAKGAPKVGLEYLQGKRGHKLKSIKRNNFRLITGAQVEKYFPASCRGFFNRNDDKDYSIDVVDKACFYPMYAIVLPYPEDPSYAVAKIFYKVFSEGDGDGPPKFLTPTGRPPIPFVPFDINLDDLLDPSKRLYIVESPFKAAAAASYGVNCIGVNGCHATKVKDAKLAKDATPLLARLTIRPELHAYLIEAREVSFLTDRDVFTNMNVAKAQLDFMDASAIGFGCNPLYTELPDLGDGKTGADDYFGAGNTLKDFEKLPTYDRHSRTVGLLRCPFMDLTEKGLGDRFVVQHGADCRHDPRMGVWFSWTEGGWITGPTEPIRAMKLVIESLKPETAAARGPAKKAHSDFEKQCGKLAVAVAGLKQAAVEKALEIDGTRFDAEQDLLGTQNCIVRLSTGERLEWSRDMLVSKRIACDFDPKAQAPIWSKFIHTICGGDRDMSAYLQEIAGSCLAGRSVRQEVFFLTGEGANGKSVYIETLMRMIGEYAVNVPAALLMKKPRAADPDRATPFLVTLIGKRLATCSEWDENTAIDEAMLKNLTGGDEISVRANYKDPVPLRNRARVLFRTNHFPVVRGTGKGTWDRIKDVPFLVTIPDEDQDPDLAEKIAASELSGVFAWALEGYRRYAANHFRFNTPRVVDELTAEHRKISDVLGTWFEECVEVENGARELQGEVTKNYSDWCRLNNHEPMSSKNLWSKLRERLKNSELTYRGDGGMYARGIKLRRNMTEVNLIAHQHQEVVALKEQLRAAKGIAPATTPTTQTTPFGEKVIPIKRGRKK